MESLKELYKIGCGPSSSHTMGPQKAAKYIKKKYPQATNYKVVLFQSLALTGKGHLTDYILKKELGENQTIISFDFNSIVDHPNTLIIEAYKDNNLIGKHTFISVGGGSLLVDGVNSTKNKSIYPFKKFSEIKRYCEREEITLAEFVYRFDDSDIKIHLNNVLSTMKRSLDDGLNANGVLPGNLHVQRKAKTIFESKNIDERVRLISSFAYAVSEENASGGEIVTAPTCGASGVLPATLLYLQQKFLYSDEQLIDALACAGVIGNIIKTNACISGAFAGCQSEIGSACSMAASATAYLQNESIDVIEYAAEIAMEHHLGLTCDPVDGLVQIPCIERNAVAALRALDAATLAKIAFTSHKVSFDTVVDTMYQTGKDLNRDYRETSIGGLAKYYQKEDE